MKMRVFFGLVSCLVLLAPWQVGGAQSEHGQSPENEAKSGRTMGPADGTVPRDKELQLVSAA